MSLKIVFMGTSEFSVPTLEILIKNEFSISTVYTQPPKKSKRGQKINPSPIEEFSKKNKINIRNPINLNNDEEFKIFNSSSLFKFEEFLIFILCLLEKSSTGDGLIF